MGNRTELQCKDKWEFVGEGRQNQEETPSKGRWTRKDSVLLLQKLADSDVEYERDMQWRDLAENFPG